MINKLQEKTKHQTFGMYSSTFWTGKTKWVRESIAANKATIESESKDVLCIFHGVTKNGLYCDTYKLSKNKFINKLLKNMPSLTLAFKKSQGMGYETKIVTNPAYSALIDSLSSFNKINNV